MRVSSTQLHRWVNYAPYHLDVGDKGMKTGN